MTAEKGKQAPHPHDQCTCGLRFISHRNGVCPDDFGFFILAIPAKASPQ